MGLVHLGARFLRALAWRWQVELRLMEEVICALQDSLSLLVVVDDILVLV